MVCRLDSADTVEPEPIPMKRANQPNFDATAFRDALSQFATGVTVITAYNDEHQPVGITINSLTSVSLKPPLVLFCLEKEAHLYDVFKQAKYFAINILADDQEEISRYFADYRHNKKPPQLWGKPQAGSPILRGTLGWMVCKKTKAYAGGDHTIFLGETITLNKKSGSKPPLLYFHGKYRQIKG